MRIWAAQCQPTNKWWLNLPTWVLYYNFAHFHENSRHNCHQCFLCWLRKKLVTLTDDDFLFAKLSRSHFFVRVNEITLLFWMCAKKKFWNGSKSPFFAKTFFFHIGNPWTHLLVERKIYIESVKLLRRKKVIEINKNEIKKLLWWVKCQFNYLMYYLDWFALVWFSELG